MKVLHCVLVSGLILTTMLTTMCRKKEVPEQIETRPLSEEFKSAWGFKPGSYWIVRDSANNNTDSIYVTSMNSSTRVVFSDKKKFNAEEITISFNKDHLFSALILSSFPEEHIKVPFDTQSYTVYNTDTVNLKAPPADGIYYNRMLANFSSGGMVHPSVRELNFRYSFSFPSRPDIWILGTVYFRKDVGIIRRVKNAEFPSVWKVYEVIRYKIVK